MEGKLYKKRLYFSPFNCFVYVVDKLHLIISQGIKISGF